MQRRACSTAFRSTVVLIATIAACLTPAAVPARAGAAGFSAPIPLPSSYFDNWHFAVNDRDEGGAVVGTMTGANFYPLGPSGSLGDPIALTVPGGFASTAQSIAINAQGRIAVTLLYKDDTEKPSEVEHGGIGCCGRVALTSWQLGQQPPPVQVLSPAQPPVRAGEPQQVLAAPSLVVGPTAISAIWTRESLDDFSSGEFGPEGRSELIQAYGHFSEALHVRRVTSARRGVQVRQLGLAPDGSPFAAWLENRDRLVGLDGRSDGALIGPLRVLRVVKMSAPEGFATESGPSQKTVFAYFSDSRKRHDSVLKTIARRPGRGFGPVRKIAAFGDAVQARFADGFQTFAAVWERSFDVGERDDLYTRRSSGAAARRIAAARPGRRPDGLRRRRRPHGDRLRGPRQTWVQRTRACRGDSRTWSALWRCAAARSRWRRVHGRKRRRVLPAAALGQPERQCGLRGLVRNAGRRRRLPAPLLALSGASATSARTRPPGRGRPASARATPALTATCRAQPTTARGVP
jgi:hypothetical protein